MGRDTPKEVTTGGTNPNPPQHPTAVIPDPASPMEASASRIASSIRRGMAPHLCAAARFSFTAGHPGYATGTPAL